MGQKGGNLPLPTRWSGNGELRRTGWDTGALSGPKDPIATSANDTLAPAPAGTSLSTIQNELTQPLGSGSGGTSGSFSSGLESTDAPLTWFDTADTTPGGISRVPRTCSGPPRPPPQAPPPHTSPPPNPPP